MPIDAEEAKVLVLPVEKSLTSHCVCSACVVQAVQGQAPADQPCVILLVYFSTRWPHFVLCFTVKTVPVISTHDGRTIRYPDPNVAVCDSIKIDLESGACKPLCALNQDFEHLCLLEQARSSSTSSSTLEPRLSSLVVAAPAVLALSSTASATPEHSTLCTSRMLLVMRLVVCLC